MVADGAGPVLFCERCEAYGSAVAKTCWLCGQGDRLVSAGKALRLTRTVNG